ncbi:MAG: ribonuclease HII [Bryobacterales bacterium]|nr:ribonuclease HII [Acidobacteriota bacterium]MCB9384036.1 ribonuclease HII [Bryobacterales bacterium]
MEPAPASLPARPSSRFEREAREAGYVWVAGVDEVGRGCLFGPVVAGAVVLDPDRAIRGLNDSKTLDPASREALAERIRERAVACATASVDAGWIDRINIYQAARVAMEQALAKLSVTADFVLTDAMRLKVAIPHRPLIKGDARCRSIAAASILAKVERDAWMSRWAEVYPEYNLASNKGYCTPDHLEALERHGPTPAHRLSFAPVAAVAGFSAALPAEARLDAQMSLFAAGGGDV